MSKRKRSETAEMKRNGSRRPAAVPTGNDNFPEVVLLDDDDDPGASSSKKKKMDDWENDKKIEGQNGGKQEEFKVPDVPQNRQKLKEDPPSEKQLITTASSRELRNVIIDAFKDHLEGDSDVESFRELVATMAGCFPSRTYLFGTRRLPEGVKVEDISSDMEVDIFARWVLFGIPSLLFCSKQSVTYENLTNTTKLLSTLSELLVKGHQDVVGRIAPQFLKMLRCLMIRTEPDLDDACMIDLDLCRRDAKTTNLDYYNFKIPILKANRWILPHYLHAVSPLIRRMFSHQATLLYVFLNTLEHSLNSFFDVETVAAVLSAFPTFNMIDANSFYMTQNTQCKIFANILQAPTLTNYDITKLRLVFSQLDNEDLNRNSHMEGSCISILQLGLVNFIYSDQILNVNKEDLNLMIVEAYRVVIQTCSQAVNEYEYGLLPLMGLLSKKGLQAILHPLLEIIIFRELVTHIERNKASTMEWKARNASTFFEKVIKLWEDEVQAEYKRFAQRSSQGLFPETEQETALFYAKTAHFTKLISRMINQLKEYKYCVEFIESKHLTKLQNMIPPTVGQLNRFGVSNGRKTYASIVEIIDNICFPDSLGALISRKLRHIMVCLVGLPWMPSLKQFIPKDLSMPSCCLDASVNDVRFVKDSSICTSKCLRAMRADTFRPWCNFVAKVYSFVMKDKSTLKHMDLVREILEGITSVSWIFKDILPLKTTFMFLANVVDSNLWKHCSNVRCQLAGAISSLPCVFHYKSSVAKIKDTRTSYRISRSGCENSRCTSSVKTIQEDNPLEQVYLADDHVRRIMGLALPLMKSNFLNMKFQLTNLVGNIHNHVNRPSMIVIAPMIELAVVGEHSVISEEVFLKVGQTVGRFLQKFPQETPGTTPPVDVETAHEIFSTIVPKICEEQTKSKGNIQPRLRKRIVKGALSFSTACDMSALAFLEVMKCVLPLVAITNCNSVTSYVQLTVAHFAEVLKCQPHELMSRFRRDISKCIVRSVITAFCPAEPDSLNEDHNRHLCNKFLERVKYIGKFRVCFARYFFPTLMEIIVPELHSNSRPQLKFLLSCISENASVSILTLLQENIMYYFPTIVLNYEANLAIKCLENLQEDFNFDAVFAAKHQEQRILNEVLCRLGDREEKVLWFLNRFINSKDQSLKFLHAEQPSINDAKITLQTILKDRLLGFFIHLDTKLQSRIETVDSKEKILKSFTTLMKLLGRKHIPQVKSKVYKTLYSATKDGRQFHTVLYSAWSEFVRSLDDASLGPVAVQILATILPLRQTASLIPRVERLMTYIIQERQPASVPHYHEMYFLIENINNPALRQIIETAVKKLKKTDWTSYFNMIAKQCASENPPVRYEAFKTLHEIFRSEFSLIETNVIAKGQEYVSGIITTILNGARGSGSIEDEKLRHIIVECIGCMGALDPLRFRSIEHECDSKRTLSTELASSCQLNTFIVRYLGKLVDEFQEVKDTTNFDYIACLIQIALKEMDVNPSVPDDPIWSQLTKEQQETITPMLSTKYQMEAPTNTKDIPSPVYLSAHGNNFENWLVNWMCVLISCIKARKDTLKAHAMFLKSMSVLRTNVRICSFIIPFVAMYAIFCANEYERSTIVTEITTILERWVILDELKRKAQSIAPIRETQFESGVDEEPISLDNESVFHSRCTKVVFSVLDHLLRASSLALKRMYMFKVAQEKVGHGFNMDRTVTPMLLEDVVAIESVLKAIPTLLISEVACNCGSFPTALYYFELSLKKKDLKDAENQKHMDYYQRLHICLGDLDSVGGIAAYRTGNPSFAGQILENIVNGKTQESVRSLSQKVVEDSQDFHLHQALIRAYLEVDEPHQAEFFIESTLVKQPMWETDLQEVHMESLVRLQKWQDLDSKVNDLEAMKGNEYLDEKFSSWNVAIPRVVSKLVSGQIEAASQVVSEQKTHLIGPLLASCDEMYPYKQAYPYVVQLHILKEVEDVMTILRKYSNSDASSKQFKIPGCKDDITHLLENWETRLWKLNKSRKIIDQVLSVRKTLCYVLKTKLEAREPEVTVALNGTLRDYWLDSAREASKTNDFVRANNCLEQAKQFMSPKVMIEEAKILRRMGRNEAALGILKTGIPKWFPHYASWKVSSSGVVRTSKLDQEKEQKLLCSKALLLCATLCEEQKLLNMNEYMAKFKEPMEVCKDSEKNIFALGSYYDRLWSNGNKNNPGCYDLQACVVRYYSQSLIYGCKYVYQSLPRLLQIWFDLAAGVHKGQFTSYGDHGMPLTCQSANAAPLGPGPSTGQTPNTPDSSLNAIISAISKMAEVVPPYILMTAFTQLVSRLCHLHASTWDLLKQIIVRIMAAHPHATLWMTMCVNKSYNPMRKRRCVEIMKALEIQGKQSNLKDTINQYNVITENLIKLSDYPSGNKVKRDKISSMNPKFKEMCNNGKFDGKVCIPFQEFIHPSLPRKGHYSKHHSPYPESLVFVSGIDDHVDVMASLARPKKITLVGSNGKKYGLLCKPKDDLRKDGKVMEVNNVVNWYLSQNAEASQRNLYVRTYSVVALNEGSGLLEWVPNLVTLRSTIQDILKEKGLPIPRLMLDSHSLEAKRNSFIELLKKFPPVFGDWFFNTFNDHQSWYTARMSYVRTAAVMSIVGYMMGLGDRHCENILIDKSSGELVHVDFNCIFNKGETFTVPERVPFRLTQNVVDGMGPLKVEGVFRKSCEVVMEVFREQRNVFLSVLRPFVFDPLVEWEKNKHGRNQLPHIEAGEADNDQAKEIMKYIRNRLNGTARNSMKEINTEYSVKAHVNYLLEEAQSPENLCQMFPGWAPHF